MHKIENSEEFRQNVVAKLTTILDDETVSSNLEKGIFNYSLEHAEKLNVVKKWDNSYFVKIYLDRLRTIYINLKHDGIKQSMKIKSNSKSKKESMASLPLFAISRLAPYFCNTFFSDYSLLHRVRFFSIFRRIP